MNSVIEIDLDNRLEYLNEFDDNRIADRLCQYILDSYVDFKEDVELKVKFKRCNFDCFRYRFFGYILVFW